MLRTRSSMKGSVRLLAPLVTAAHISEVSSVLHPSYSVPQGVRKSKEGFNEAGDELE